MLPCVLKYVNLIIHLHIAIVLINNMSGFNEYIKTGYINLHYKTFFSILTTKYDAKNHTVSCLLVYQYIIINDVLLHHYISFIYPVYQSGHSWYLVVAKALCFILINYQPTHFSNFRMGIQLTIKGWPLVHS